MAEKQEKDLQKVRELVELMKENDLVEVEIVDGDLKIHLKRPCADARMVQYAAPAPMMAPPVAAPAPAPAPATSVADAGTMPIKSPIVGTFYQASSPDSPPYVKVGDKVSPDTTVCSIEAMKVMNEIKAETSGTVIEVCCKDGQAVEFGQPLFKIRP
jgi:acetyl-CoA carboxylase biotin carboxyl carrier protein